ncbi:hypothetical protein F4009_16285 [Candidatus Poribacteria bacterium]|nr:hypothetical protein [Candidatus Poribacteria bacterium]MYH83677.1 hypothetical protein [Candidatus Poribacteria bacterium]MYK95529.1 hypothetical protein [Candidatus Poribacteria bacterium]
MENIVELAVMAVIIILSLVVRYSRQRKAQQQNAERRVEENTHAESDGDVAPPPFMEDFPFATELEQMMAQEDEDETEAVPAASEEPKPPAPQDPAQPIVENQRPQPPPVPVESPTGIRSVPATSLLDLSPQTFRQGIILKEILERPRSRRTRRNRNR